MTTQEHATTASASVARKREQARNAGALSKAFD
jgi:hypothetical protein